MSEPRNSQLALIAMGLCNNGPDLTKISESIGMPLDELRRKYWRYFVARNMKVQALPSIAKLGLRRVLTVIELSPRHTKFFDAMQHVGSMLYMTSLSETTIPFVYAAYFTLPSEEEGRIKDCFSDILAHFDVREINWNSFASYRRVPMNVECFDFERSMWNDSPSSVELPDMKPVSDQYRWDESGGRFDRIDVSIVRNLEYDAAVSANQISRSLASGLAHKTGNTGRDRLGKVVCYHKARHVLRRGLVNGYSIDWTRAARVTNGVWQPITRYVNINVVTDRLARGELGAMASTASAVPFLWSEASGAGKYFARFHVPCCKAEGVRTKLTELSSVDNTLIELNGRSVTFGLNTSFYDDNAGWAFDEVPVASAIKERMLDAYVPPALL